MKTLRLLTVAFALSIFALPATGLAAKSEKKKGGKGAAKALASYDADKSGSIDGDEIKAVRSAFESEKDGPFKSLDKNSDGQLSDEEISAAKVKAKGKKKKNA